MVLSSGVAAKERAQGAALAVGGLGKRWRTGAEAWVLRDVELSLAAGTVAWVGGANGTGKTTLLRMLSGILAPDEGQVCFRGLDGDRERRAYQRQVGLVSAGDRALYARLRVRHHLELWMGLAFVPRAQQRDRLEEAAAAFGLTELLERRADRLSLGQRQRVRLALATLHRPGLLLLDEPANSLDDEGLSLLRDAVRSVTVGGGVVVWCSPPHERETIGSDAAFLIASGRLAAA